MKTYHFATPTPSYGIVHTTVTCNHQEEAEYIFDECRLKTDPTAVQRLATRRVVAALTWELFTVKPVAGGGREALLQARELQPLSKENAIVALKEMKIQQDIILAEQDAINALFMAKRAAFVMKIGGANPRNIHPKNPLNDEYVSLDSTHMNVLLHTNDRCSLENQRELVRLALANQDKIITTTAV